MTASIVVRPSAERDIDEAFTWYLGNAPDHTHRFLDDLEDSLDRLRYSPRLAHVVYRDIRRTALRTFPYLIWFIWFMYVEEPDAIVVLAVSHQRQDPNVTRRRLS